MLKAAALVYALTIALLIAMISGSLILYSLFNSEALESYRMKNLLLENANSGITLLLSEQNIVGLNEKKTISLFGEKNDSVELERKSWGVLEVILVTSKWKRELVKKTAIVGNSGGSDTSMCFYLCDQDAPLAVCGKTELRGTCYLPKQGIKDAFIEGENFIGTNPVKGLSKTSERNLPHFNNDLFNAVAEILEQGSNIDEVKMIDAYELPDSLENPFSSAMIEVFSAGKITLTGKYLSGNICIRSESEVQVNNSTHLENVTVYAPEIRVEKEFTGSAQFFASDTIVIGEGTRMEFPSVVGIVRTNGSPANIYMGIMDKVSINGDVFSFERTADNQKQMFISIAAHDTIIGQVFSNGVLSLRGTVWGSVSCHRLLLKTNSAAYENHLLDVVIDRTQLPIFYAGMDVWKTQEQKKIIEWIYE